MQKAFDKLRQVASYFSPNSASTNSDNSPSTTTDASAPTTVACPHANKKTRKVPSYFEEKDESKLFDIIDKNAFAVLIMTNDDGTIQLCHAPFFLDREKRILRGHLAKRNPMYEMIKENRPMTVVFPGPHSYISPQFMVDPYNRVPTWNYCYAHVHGTSEVMTDEELFQVLDDMSSKYEGDSPNAWKLDGMNQARLKSQAKAIFGVRIKIERLEGDFEFGLDAEEDQPGVIKGLKARGQDYDRTLAQYMAKAWNMEDK